MIRPAIDGVHAARIIKHSHSSIRGDENGNRRRLDYVKTRYLLALGA